MNLQTIESRTGLPQRTLRYVIDHKLVPNLRVRVVENEPGRPRVFSDDVGIAITCAAWLLEAGLKREAVTTFLKCLEELNFEPKNPRKGLALSDIIRNRTPATVQIGDGTNCRCIVTSSSETADSGWLQPKPLAKLDAAYQPLVVVQLDLGRIFNQLFD